MDRISTGNRQADVILGGGFPERSINYRRSTAAAGACQRTRAGASPCSDHVRLVQGHRRSDARYRQLTQGVVHKDGLDVYPRLVSPVAFGPGYRRQEERLTTGVNGLDSMIKTGWRRGTSTLVSGPAGAGRTVLGLHFLREGLRHGEPGLLVTFQENPTQLSRMCASLGWRPDEMPACGALDVFYTSPVELQIDSIVGEIMPMVDNIVLLELHLGDTVERTIRVTKTRGSAHDGRRYPLLISATGMAVERAR